MPFFPRHTRGERISQSRSKRSTGAIGHAEIMINGSHFMLADENPGWGNKSPLSLGGTAVTFSLIVENADTAAEQAQAAGATVEMPPSDIFYGFRSAAISDPFGIVASAELENMA